MAERQREITLRFLAGATDMNIMGKVHGGAVMKWIDEAGYACAAAWSGLPCVTVYVGGIRFYQPILVGSLVEVHAKLIYTGRTSLHVSVDVRSTDPRENDYQTTTHCVIVFVAIDNEGQPVPVPAWVPATAEDMALHNYARRLLELRKTIEEEISPHLP